MNKIEQHLEDIIENAITNATGLPFDLHANYSKEYTDLLPNKTLIYLCENHPYLVTESRCDLVTK